MAKEKQATVGTPAYIKTLSDFDKAKGESYGGQSDILEINENQCAGPFQYLGKNAMTLEGKTVVSHQAQTPEGQPLRMPISATFLKAADMAVLQPGDKFLVARHTDSEKKAGLGKGTAMPIYGIKVIERAVHHQQGQ